MPILAVLLLPLVAAAQQPDARLRDSVTWLEQESHRIVRASMRRMHDGSAAFPPQVGIGYEAFWLRDYEYTLDLVEPALADKIVIDMVAHIPECGACEWIFGEQRKLPNYLASACLPLAGMRTMLERRTERCPR